MRRLGRLDGKRADVRAATTALAALLVILAVAPGCSSLPRTQRPVTESSIQAGRYRELGLKNYRTGRYQRAEEYFLRELAIHAAVDRRAGVVETLASLGRTSLACGEHDAAEARFQQALEAAGGLLRPDLEAQAYGGLGALALWRQQPETARHWLSTALELPLDDPSHERAVLLHDLGAAHRMLRDDETAEVLLRRALAMHETLRNRAGIATASQSLARLYADGGRLDEALYLAYRALQLDKLTDNAEAVAQDLTLLGRLSADAGRLDQARQYYRRADLAWRALGRMDASAEIAARLQELPGD